MRVSIPTKVVEASPKTICQEWQTAAENGVVSEPQAAAGAPGFPKEDRGESRKIDRLEQKEAPVAVP
jgi:hypothetical protein